MTLKRTTKDPSSGHKKKKKEKKKGVRRDDEDERASSRQKRSTSGWRTRKRNPGVFVLSFFSSRNEVRGLEGTF